MDKDTLKDSLALWAKALNTFVTVLQLKNDSVVRDSAIKRFEYNYELAWKTIRRFLEVEGYRADSPRSSFKLAASLGWIVDEEIWLDMIEDRNQTTHTYQEAVAEEVFANLPKYCDAMQKLHNLFKTKSTDI